MNENLLEIMSFSRWRVRAKPRREGLQSLSQAGAAPPSGDKGCRGHDDHDHHHGGDKLKNRHIKDVTHLLQHCRLAERRHDHVGLPASAFVRSRYVRR
jgi:hypothetical protein